MTTIITKTDLKENREIIIEMIISQMNKESLKETMTLLIKRVELNIYSKKRSIKSAIENATQDCINDAFKFGYYKSTMTSQEVEDMMEKSKRNQLPSSMR